MITNNNNVYNTKSAHHIKTSRLTKVRRVLNINENKTNCKEVKNENNFIDFS